MGDRQDAEKGESRMTNQEASKVIKDGLEDMSLDFADEEQYEALTMAIKALQEPSGDLISRADAINALGYDISIESDGGLDKYKSVIKEMICKIYDVQKANIEKLPSVKQEPKEGHWIVHPKGVYAHLVCDKCLSNAPYDCRTNYCPNCGAWMVEPQESERV